MLVQPYYVPDFLVKVEGLTLEADVSRAVMSLTYDNDLDAADMFTLQIDNSDLRFTDSALFEVGKTIEIYMGYVENLQPMMLGEITAISPDFSQSGASVLTVTGYDRSQRMRHNQPKHRTFEYVNDSAIVTQIAIENLFIPVVDPVPMPVREAVHQTGSDWALLKELADRNNFQVYVRWNELYFRFPRPQTEMVVLEWGKNLSSFSPRLSVSGQAGIQEIQAYDHRLAQSIVMNLSASSLASDLDDLIERLGSEFIDRLVQSGKKYLYTASVENYLDATVLAKSLLMQLLQGLYEASGHCIGIPTLRAGDLIEIRGVGQRFSGQYRLSKVIHQIDQGGYQTRFEVSQKHTTTLLGTLRRKTEENSLPEQQPKVNGVVVGKVINNRYNPEKPGEVEVQFLDMKAWARVATPMAGQDKGTYFLPDVGDEVLLAFEEGNTRYPRIIGSLWTGQARPIEINQGANNRKVIQTKSGMKIVFDETSGQESLMLQDKNGSTIKINSASGNITIESANHIIFQDKQGSTIQMNSDTGNITIEAKNNVVIKSGEGIIDLNPG